MPGSGDHVGDVLSVAQGVRGLKLDQAKGLKELERENARLRKAVSDLTLDKLILKEAAEGNFFSIRGA